MLNAIVKHIKTNIAQHTHLFDTSRFITNATLQNNEISINVGSGFQESTLANVIDLSIASAGCVNDTHHFINGNATTDCFFGDESSIHSVEVATLNVGHAFKRDVALEAIMDTKSGNIIVVYVGSASALSDQYLYSDSEDMNFKVGYTIGVFFKINTIQIQELGCADYDKLFINSVIGARKTGTSLVKFNNVIDRFFAGDSYVVDMEFSYIDEMFMEDSFLNGLKHFDATLGDLKV